MESDWDARAREAPEHYIATARQDWDPEEFFRSGEINVDNEVLADPEIELGGRMLEIGCGAGRMTRALAAVFEEVYAVDISAEMIALARRNLADLENVQLYKNNGADLGELPSEAFGFAFSYIVFQHIPSLEVIVSYIREVYRCLKPGGVFKFQVQGDTSVREHDSWTGVSVSAADIELFTNQTRFELLRAQGQGTQYFWLWFRKPGPARLQVPAEPVEIQFKPPTVAPGEEYTVRIPGFTNQTVDVRYEFQNTTGVVGKWCVLDANGEARIPVPVGHLAGNVGITAVRSRTENGPWHPASAFLQIKK